MGVPIRSQPGCGSPAWFPSSSWESHVVPNDEVGVPLYRWERFGTPRADPTNELRSQVVLNDELRVSSCCWKRFGIPVALVGITTSFPIMSTGTFILLLDLSFVYYIHQQTPLQRYRSVLTAIVFMLLCILRSILSFFVTVKTFVSL